MEGKSSTQKVRFLTRCLPIAFTLNNVGQFRSRLGEIFEIPKMFAWTNRMEFDNVPNFFGFLFEKSWVFENILIFFKIGSGGKFAVESVSNDFIS